MSTVHELKTDPEVFQLSWDGKKPWEIRFNDRDYAIGDRLILLETKYSGEDIAGGKPLKYTGRQIQARITAIVEGYGLEKGWVILSVCIEEQTYQEACAGLSLSDVLKAAAPEQIQEALCDEKPKWNGPEDGLPPVGENVEVRFRHPRTDYSDWFEGVLKAGFDSKIWFSEATKGGLFEKEYVMPSHDVEFRPIKTERERVIEQMIKDLGANIYVNDRSFAEVLYDAGYRMTEVE